ncbi:hypothetical protein [Streptomyces aureus]|uniref:Integrase n=1 Tax=Streptomyces aureus TaxID=193461 RepID=A0ABV4SIT4_9ACTN
MQTCRRELLDRALVWNQHHLLHALHDFATFYNGHRPHQGTANTRPLRPLPSRSPTRSRSPTSRYGNAAASAASSTRTNMPRDLVG